MWQFHCESRMIQTAAVFLFTGSQTDEFVMHFLSKVVSEKKMCPISLAGISHRLDDGLNQNISVIFWRKEIILHPPPSNSFMPMNYVFMNL